MREMTKSGATTYSDGTQRKQVDCPSCRMQRWIDADCHHCGNSAVSCLKHYSAIDHTELQQAREEIRKLRSGSSNDQVPSQTDQS